MSEQEHPPIDGGDETTDGPAERLQAEIGFEIGIDADGKKSLRMEGTAAIVADVMAKAAKAGEYRRGANQAFKEIARDIEPYDERDVSGREAAELLERIIPKLCAHGEEIFGRTLPAWDWYYMIRRVPLTHLWNNQAAMTVRGLMAGLALARNTTRTKIPRGGVLEVTRKHGERLTFLSGYASIIAILTMGYRVVGKGGAVVLRPKAAAINIKHLDAATQRRVLEYDARVAEEGAWGGFGIHIPELHRVALSGSGKVDGTLGLVFARAQPLWNEDGPGGTASLERYGERYVELEDVFTLLANENAPSALQLDPELGPLLCLAATYALARRAEVFEQVNVMRVGYSLHVGTAVDVAGTRIGESMRQALAWARPRLPEGSVPRSPDELWQRLEGMRPSMWPLRPGPLIVGVAADAFLIDWGAGTGRLLHALRYPRVQGETANLRGRAFEDSVRDAVGGTRFAPAPWLKALEGRHLQLDASGPFGEIDAGASIPGYNVHLVISCKSYPYTEAYERGDHRAVRNVSDNLANDARTVLELCVTLMQNRQGRNYQIPDDAHLVPVLVTPRVMWSASDICWERIITKSEGPPLCCGVAELLAFLERIPGSAETGSQE